MADKAPRPHPDEMTFLEHLDELRSRLIRCVIALVVSFALAGVFVRPIFQFVEAPIKPFLNGQNLVFTRLSEPFFIYMKVAFLASLFIAAPYVLSELWLFVSPGLYTHERRYALPFVVAASLLFISGGAFGYYMVFPATCRFFLQVGEGFTHRGRRRGLRGAGGDLPPRPGRPRHPPVPAEAHPLRDPALLRDVGDHNPDPRPGDLLGRGYPHGSAVLDWDRGGGAGRPLPGEGGRDGDRPDLTSC
jgi:hypothetical protein